ncbi:ABC transporter ATP-binding protein [Chloroflexota bacterium]
MDNNIVLDVQDLKTYFYTRRGVVKAVDGANFSLNKGEVLGLVGESGCGKTITSLSILRLVPQPAGRIVGGKIILDGEDLITKTEGEMREIRGKKISMILQDPMSSLNPVFTIGDQLMEAITIHQKLKGPSLWQNACDTLKLVNIPSPEVRLKDFPHQLSGGMRQRVVGAISISCKPSILIADEPTTSLDVTIQSQYLQLLKKLQEEVDLSIIFITHDFGIVAELCDRVCVMYAGKVVENAPVLEIFDQPMHPYTQALIASVPAADKRVGKLFSIEGKPPELLNMPTGCAFRPRCSHYDENICKEEFPPEVFINPHHSVSCWRVN